MSERMSVSENESERKDKKERIYKDKSKKESK
jgi:hypothetical protein